MPDLHVHPVAKCCWCRASLVRDKDGHWWCAADGCNLRQRQWALALQEGMAWRFFWVPTPAQVECLSMAGRRKLIGGAAGGGKSDLARKGAYRLCVTYPGLSVLLLRKTNPELERTHIRAMRREQHAYPVFDWMEQAKECRFHNGSVIECGYMDDDAAVQKFLSSEYDLIIPEEAVQYPPDPLMELMSRARSTKAAVKAAGGPWVWLPTNPGGPSHQLLKELFITRSPDVERYPALATQYDAADWTYFQAKLDDNPYMDPDYERVSLAGLRRTRYQQLRHGDWDAAEGQFFEMFSAQTHTRTLTPHAGAEWVEAFDWGYTQPACWGAFWHVGDNHWHCQMAIKQNKLEPQEWAALIKEKRAELGYQRPKYAVADPKIFSEDRGESIAETFARHGVRFLRASNRRADSEREMGWPRLGSWFRLDAETVRADGSGVPWLTFDPDLAAYPVRSIPALLADPHNPEDVDTSLDDHAADMCRYFVMSRPPLARTVHVPRPTAPVFSPDWLRSRTAASPGLLG